jgi:hypothetical protein
MVEAITVLALGVALAALFLFRKSSKTPAPYPPGPPQKFFIGNAKDVPAAHKELKFAEWGKQYGMLDHFVMFLDIPWLVKY